MNNTEALTSARSSARGSASARVAASPRDEAKSSRSDASEIVVGSSRRSDAGNTGRKPEGSVGGAPETFRTSMDTARVHTALAALSAEKQALLAKLNMIDSALENDGRKKAKVPRHIPLPTKKPASTHK